MLDRDDDYTTGIVAKFFAVAWFFFFRYHVHSILVLVYRSST